MKKLMVLLLAGMMIFNVWGGFIFAREAATPTVASGATSDISGTWLGALKVSGIEMRLVFKITKNADGSLSSTMDSPDQGVKGIPVALTTFSDGKLQIEMPIIQGSFDGVINSDGTEIAGEWKQGVSYPLTLKRTQVVEEARRPQEPKPPFPYHEEEVTYQNQTAGIILAGTLTIPEGKGSFPAVIMVSGSGAQDRNETILNHKPFWVIADYLTRRGIAVLRVDDRGVGGSGGNLIQSTSSDLAGDALAGVEYLKKRKDINPKQIGLIGHSEGGIITPLAATRSKDVAFIVMLAGPGLKGSDILLKQNELIIKASGGSDQDVAKQLDLLNSVFKILQETDPGVVKTKIHELAEKTYNEMSDADKQASGNSSANLEAGLLGMTTPWFRFFIGYDPIPTLKKVTCPVLALNGSKDLQVPPAEDLAAIAAALKAGKNKDYTIKELPNLNHLFQKCTTGSPSEYGTIEETFSPDALKIMGDWIVAHTQKKK
ncbi:MAG TPA: alpha/beta fold hydrolase [Bacillota bacterium]|nr:alpha/beta fold hydrolase [Bacillota bacterium]